MLILKRNPCDVFTNNYNNKLLNYHEANKDIQYVSDTPHPLGEGGV